MGSRREADGAHQSCGAQRDDHQGFAEKVVANGGKILSKPGEVPIKYRAPDGTVAEIVPKGRNEKMRDN
jgi:lactoylglutathione lyase